MRVAFKTLGCRVNQAETAAMAADFERLGFTVVPPDSPCEVFVVHGCAVTRLAERQSLRETRAAGRQPGWPLVVLAGCAAELKEHRGLRPAGADLLVGQAEKTRLAHLVAERLGLALPASPATATPRHEGHRAILKAQDGCAFHCAYCIVPALRGPPVSRPLTELLAEATAAIRAGYQELVLSGINLGLWTEGPLRLPHLLERIAALPGLGRIRLGSLELSTVERDVLSVMAGHPRICAALHVPLQSGDDGILRAMGRRYTADQFRAFAEEAAARVPRLGFGTDVISGYPGEDEAAFAGTIALLERLPISNIHAFPYSPRPGTRAAALPDAVPPAVKAARVAELLALKARKREAFARSFLGQTVEVLAESNHAGWTAEYLRARLPERAAEGALVPLRVTAVERDVLV